MCTMRDLDEWMSVEDVYDLIEVASVNAHNTRAAQEAARARDD